VGTLRAQESDPSAPGRVGAALAAGGGLVVALAGLAAGPEELDEGVPGAAVRRYYETNQDAIGWLVVAESVSFAAMILFVVGLRSLARGTGERARVPADLILVSGTLTAVWIWVQGSLDLVPVVMLDDDGTLSPYDDQTLLALDLVARIGETMGDLATVPRGLLVLGVSLLALRSRLLPRWLAWFGLVIAAASLASIVGVGTGLTPFLVAFFVGLFGFPLWLLGVAVVLGVRALRPGRGATPTAAAAEPRQSG
jgi:hypothetical protein